MSDVERLKQQLQQVSSEAKQVADGLGGFKSKFGQHIGQVQSLISGTATGADQEIIQLLDTAAGAVEDAINALAATAEGCRTFAERV